MKTLIKFSIVLSLALATLGRHTSAQALFMSKFNGYGASASFVNMEGCLQTNVDIFTNEGMLKEGQGKPKPVSNINIYISRYDLCENVQVLYVDAVTVLPEPDLQIATKLQEATLSTTLNVTDTVTGNTFDMVIDIAWVGMGPTTRARHNFRFGDATCRVQDKYNAIERGAVATGTVWYGTENLTPEPSVGGLLISSNGRITAIGCN